MSNTANWSQLGTTWLNSGAILGVSSGRVLLGAGKLERTSRPDFVHRDQASFYAPDFFLTHEKPWLNFETTFEVSTLELLQYLTELNFGSSWGTSVEPLQWPAPPKDRFERAFDYLQNEIRQGTLEKGVPFTFERAQAAMTPARLLASLKAMLTYALERPVMPYGFWDSEEGILGCTPELLFRRDGKTIRTMAMAGTRRHDEQGRLPLLEDPKERREHQLVIDSIVTELKGFGKVSVGQTEVAVLPQLSHLKTSIELAPDQSDAAAVSYDALIRALHPTPALGAFPREAGWKWLHLLESQNDLQRHRYGAPFGAAWKDSNGQDQGLAVVAIRNVQWQSDRILLCAGCGVIAESEFEREWQEVNGKIRAIKGILSL
jgi:menaquinone-specific isochorismate synthase